MGGSPLLCLLLRSCWDWQWRNRLACARRLIPSATISATTTATLKRRPDCGWNFGKNPYDSFARLQSSDMEQVQSAASLRRQQLEKPEPRPLLLQTRTIKP